MLRGVALVGLAACLPSPHAGTGTGDGGGNGGPVNRAFITASSYPLNSFAKLSDVDALCTGLATSGGIPGTYKAWLSTATEPALGRLEAASGWVRPDGQPFATSAASLLSGHVLAPLRLDAAGNDVIPPGGSADAVTATTSSGTFAGATDCLGGATGFVTDGYADADALWTDASGLADCAIAYHLYCLQTDFSNPPAPPVRPSRRAFLSTETISGADQTGRAKLDTLCAHDAVAAGYARTFIALVAMKGAVPLDQLGTGPDWVRPDGIVVIDGTTKRLTAPLDVTTDLQQHTDAMVWGGSTAIDQPAAMDGTDNCDDWTNFSLNGRAGAAGRSVTTEAFGTAAPSSQCTTNAYHLYCVEL